MAFCERSGRTAVVSLVIFLHFVSSCDLCELAGGRGRVHELHRHRHQQAPAGLKAATGAVRCTGAYRVHRRLGLRRQACGVAQSSWPPVENQLGTLCNLAEARKCHAQSQAGDMPKSPVPVAAPRSGVPKIARPRPRTEPFLRSLRVWGRLRFRHSLLVAHRFCISLCPRPNDCSSTIRLEEFA